MVPPVPLASATLFLAPFAVEQPRNEATSLDMSYRSGIVFGTTSAGSHHLRKEFVATMCICDIVCVRHMESFAPPRSTHWTSSDISQLRSYDLTYLSSWLPHLLLYSLLQPCVNTAKTKLAMRAIARYGFRLLAPRKCRALTPFITRSSCIRSCAAGSCLGGGMCGWSGGGGIV